MYNNIQQDTDGVILRQKLNHDYESKNSAMITETLRYNVGSWTGKNQWVDLP